jgi:SpoVK/Ycf46/Vps4 family AAA+-type ATPase
MAIISSKKQPQEPNKQPKQSQESQATAKPEILQPEAAVDEGKQEESIRPHRFVDYIGQKDLKDVLEIAIKAAQSRSEVLDHLLLYGPPGLGKTTMAMILASEMGVNYKITSAPALERPRDIVGLLVNLKPGDVLFIDEIHRLSRMTEEILYPAMEDYRLDITVGKVRVRDSEYTAVKIYIGGSNNPCRCFNFTIARSLRLSSKTAILRSRRNDPDYTTHRSITTNPHDPRWCYRNRPSFARNTENWE